jgi:hypothetical protein
MILSAQLVSLAPGLHLLKSPASRLKHGGARVAVEDLPRLPRVVVVVQEGRMQKASSRWYQELATSTLAASMVGQVGLRPTESPAATRCSLAVQRYWQRAAHSARLVQPEQVELQAREASGLLPLVGEQEALALAEGLERAAAERGRLATEGMLRVQQGVQTDFLMAIRVSPASLPRAQETARVVSASFREARFRVQRTKAVEAAFAVVAVTKPEAPGVLAGFV